MANYISRKMKCDSCGKEAYIIVRTDLREPCLCTSCKPSTPILGAPKIRTGAPVVSKISGFGKSFEDFDRDYDRMNREGA
jgi:hypothetical protein